MKHVIKRCLMISLLFSSMHSFAESESAVEYFNQKVAAQQLPEATAAFINKDYKKAFDLYRPLAEKGDKVSEYQLGYLYQNGFGVPKDNQQAVTWYKKASAQDFPPAQYALATLYYYGLGVEQSLTQALELY